MRDAITAAPKPPVQPAELAYSLLPDDYVAYWVHLAQRSQMPKRVHKAIRDAVGVTWSLVWIPSIALSIVLCGVYLPVGIPCAIVSVFGFGFGFVLNRIDNAPGTCFRGWLSWPYRWLCLWALRRLARSEAAEGTLDTRSLLHFAMTAEGFTLTTEFASSSAGLGPPATREDRVPWAALEDVDFTEDHVFLTVRKGVAVILPNRCFTDSATMLEFASLVLGSRAEVRREPSSTSIFAPEARVVVDARKPFAS